LEEAMKNSAVAVDPKRYGRLLARKLPAVIRTEEENARLIVELQELDGHYGDLTPEEHEYHNLLVVLIEAFEDAHYALEGSTPDSRLRSLMEEHGLRQRDLLAVFGSRGIATKVVRREWVVSGKRAISKTQAKRLAELFHVPADLFL
jgi:HTH-type transcriptional regulator/antitoxin HigA